MWTHFQTQLTGPRTGIQKFPQYYPSSMLPPPPPAPMARPVAIIRSTGELATTASSPPTSSTSPTDPAELGPNQEQINAAATVGLVGSACQNSVESAGRKSPARILVTPHTSREYTFAHFHSQPGQVNLLDNFSFHRRPLLSNCLYYTLVCT